MNDKNYIEQVRSALNSSDDNAESIKRVSELTLPNDANPLLALIHGDSQQLEYATNYARNDDPANPSDGEIEELSNRLSKEIFMKLQKYLADWDDGNHYYYSFQLKATYGAFKNNQGEVEYIDVYKINSDIKTVKEAVQVAKDWENTLLERIIIYVDQETGHKRISTKPVYTILDTHHTKITTGNLEFDDEQGMSTWLNQA